ncbi:ATP-binding protein, partial [Streptomyces zhihengii]|uniref:ATP-binding protein n=1 Tax=Streptomyces zhihengii TaxID=1818004 RepID=UPI0033AD88EA
RARRGLMQAAEYQRERDAALRHLDDVRASISRGRAQVRWAVDQAERGVTQPGVPMPAAPGCGFARGDAAGDLEAAFDEAWRAVVSVATRQQQQQRQLHAQAELAEVFKSIAPRLQSLVNRSLTVISDVERDVEDPELMAELFRVDHLLTQIRREVESLAVLGGSLPPRDSAPVLLATVIRRAVQEIPEYQRVRVAPSQHASAALPGYVSPSVVHLLAALMENATGFSNDRVEVHVLRTEGGIAVEVLDRGTGMTQHKRESLNRLLAQPESADPRTRLRDGQIGLLVAALLARRHKIAIRLGPNIVGGTQAVIVIPTGLLVPAEQDSQPRQPAQNPRRTAPPPPGPLRRAHTLPGADDTAELPRRIRPDAAHDSATALQNASRPQLPRRGDAEQRIPPLTAPAPAGRATGGLMASFRSRKPAETGQSPPAGPVPPHFPTHP